MLSIPNILGRLVSKLPGRRPHRPNRNLRGQGRRGTAFRGSVLPIGLYKRRTKRRKGVDPTNREPAECCVFRHCDLMYQQMSDEQKALWKRARKKRGISAYDLWMSECITVSILGERPPDYPSISGGFNPRQATPGTELPAADCWDRLATPPPFTSCGMTHTAQPHASNYTVHVTWAANVLAYPPVQRNVRFWAYNPQTQAWWYIHALIYPATEELIGLWEYEYTAPALSTWPHGPSHVGVYPHFHLEPWSHLYPNHIPWSPPPLPIQPWPNPLA